MLDHALGLLWEDYSFLLQGIWTIGELWHFEELRMPQLTIY